MARRPAVPAPRPHLCTFVPPHVLGALARRGNAALRRTAVTSAQQSHLVRGYRGDRVVGVDTTVPAREAVAASADVAERRVYDSDGSWETQVQLVRDELGAPTGDTDADTVHGDAGITRAWFADVAGRNSIDNRGMDLVLNVHYGVAYMNAFWDGEQMTFGDGDGEIFGSFARSVEVTAHELAHGIIQFTANLAYSGQSGALNEHFADVFGSAVSQAAAGVDAGDADWLIGDEIMGPELYGEALRSMRSPGTAYDNPLLGKDPQPDHMRDLYTGPEDNGGVHINSGIPNRAFYLAASDLGTTNAARIWYAGLRQLWPEAQFADAVAVLVAASRELSAAGTVPRNGAPQVVRSAFRQVGLPG